MIIIDIIAVFIILFGAILWAYCTSKKDKYDYLSFRESLDLTGLPIITFHQDKVKLNFMLDTGSNKNIIDKSIVSKIENIPIKGKTSIMGFNGQKEVATNTKIEMSHKNKILESNFQVLDMSVPFGEIKKEFGVTIHGILGNTFMQKYKYILDFDEMVAYSKKNK